jgi:XRE family aerobic/anaerobic benzoate catabolism transcriptional regulator
MLKRRTPQELGEIRQLLADHLSATSPTPDGPRRIALIGLRGAGKSTLGALLAQELQVPFVELNREIEAEAGVTLNEIFWIYGQAGYRRLERRCLERVIAAYPAVVLATGGGIVVETATYELLLHSFLNIWLRAAMENIVNTLEARQSLYGLAPVQIDTTDKSVDQVLETLLEAVAPHRSAERSVAA